MCLLYNLCGRVWRPAVVCIFNAVVNSFEVLVDGERGVNQLIHSNIFHLQVCRSNLPVPINLVLEEVPECDSRERNVIVLELLLVGIFKGVYYLVLQSLVHRYRIILDVTYLVVLLLELFVTKVGTGGCNWEIHSWVERVHPCRIGEVVV